MCVGDAYGNDALANASAANPLSNARCVWPEVVGGNTVCVDVARDLRMVVYAVGCAIAPT